MPRAVITLTTDFGQGSPYVAQMKAVVLGINPDAVLVDITHAIPPQSVRQAAWVLADSAPCFPAGTLHIAVVDPGVGSARRLLYTEIRGQRFVAPDNGVLTGVLRDARPNQLIQLTAAQYWAPAVSRTFHGRDIMAPVAAHLSLGVSPDSLGPPLAECVLLSWPEPVWTTHGVVGELVWIDSFGNAVSNIPGQELLARAGGHTVQVRCGQARIEGLAATYAGAARGELVVLLGSHGRLELAVVQGRANERLGVGIGDAVHVSWQLGQTGG